MKNLRCHQCNRMLPQDAFDGPWRRCINCNETNKRIAKAADIDRDRKKSSGFYDLSHEARVNVFAAAAEGRLDPSWASDLGLETGRAVCAICGMRHWTTQEAYLCCNQLRVRSIDPVLCRAESVAGLNIHDSLDGLPILFDLFGDRVNTRTGK